MSASTSRYLGYVAAIVGSLAAILTGVYVSNSPNPLWALILSIFLVAAVRDTKIQGSAARPAVVGLVIGFLCLAIAGVVYYVGKADPLWAMILICFLANVVGNG